MLEDQHQDQPIDLYLQENLQGNLIAALDTIVRIVRKCMIPLSSSGYSL